MHDEFLSTVTQAPISYSVYSALSFFGRRQGGELPGLWFVRAFGILGHAPAAVRQALFRMVRAGQLQTRRSGRTKYYRLTPWAQAEADAGLARIIGPRPERWDGRWTLLLARFESGEREQRELLSELLQSEGFAPLGGGAYIHPRDRAGRVIQAAAEAGMQSRLMVVRGERQGGIADAEFVTAHWDLAKLAREYRQFLIRFGPWATTLPADDRRIFVVRFALVFTYLEPAWRDPELPAALLPDDWPGEQARELAGSLYRRLMPGALRFAKSLLPVPASEAAR